MRHGQNGHQQPTSSGTERFHSQKTSNEYLALMSSVLLFYNAVETTVVVPMTVDTVSLPRDAIYSCHIVMFDY